MLILDNNLLTHLPDDIGSCTLLEKLSASHNNLTSLPSSIASLSKLKTLSLSFNAFTSISGSSLAMCASLELLDISKNQLETIPAELSGLKKLNTLNCSGNQIACVPPPILKECVQLQTLLLHENPIMHEVCEPRVELQHLTSSVIIFGYIHPRAVSYAMAVVKFQVGLRHVPANLCPLHLMMWLRRTITCVFKL